LHPGTPARPSTPEVPRVREHAPTPSPFVVFFFGLAVESIKELGGASQMVVEPIQKVNIMCS